MEYNGLWQLIGQSGSKFRGVMGKTVRSGAFLRISKDWLKTQFYILPSLDIAAIKKDAFCDMGDKLRRWRHDLRKKLLIQRGDTPATVKQRTCQLLVGYNRADVDTLLEKWCDPTYQDYAQHMREIRARNKTPHCTGSKSLARLCNEELITTGKGLTRAQAYIKTHRKKDGTYLNREVEERVVRMEELLENDPAELIDAHHGTIRWAPNDAYAQAHNSKPKYAGHVRGVSKNILPAHGYIHSCYKPSSQNPKSSNVPQMIERAFEVERKQHRIHMAAHLT
ncbi:uncharacterized protein LOC132186629 [Corylus avellana]|uniref:uncharacterized protein LOC132186629 n=1 Tax=Corylus avellana TaxID=13451 RepID=UPI00286C542D|nr:uncharacterized protein LOC132186629 [Corylus avellana]